MPHHLFLRKKLILQMTQIKFKIHLESVINTKDFRHRLHAKSVPLSLFPKKGSKIYSNKHRFSAIASSTTKLFLHTIIGLRNSFKKTKNRKNECYTFFKETLKEGSKITSYDSVMFFFLSMQE